jgi:hypothetical protein
MVETHREVVVFVRAGLAIAALFVAAPALAAFTISVRGADLAAQRFLKAMDARAYSSAYQMLDEAARRSYSFAEFAKGAAARPTATRLVRRLSAVWSIPASDAGVRRGAPPSRYAIACFENVQSQKAVSAVTFTAVILSQPIRSKTPDQWRVADYRMGSEPHPNC